MGCREVSFSCIAPETFKSKLLQYLNCTWRTWPNPRSMWNGAEKAGRSSLDSFAEPGSAQRLWPTCCPRHIPGHIHLKGLNWQMETLRFRTYLKRISKSALSILSWLEWIRGQPSLRASDTCKEYNQQIIPSAELFLKLFLFYCYCYKCFFLFIMHL